MVSSFSMVVQRGLHVVSVTVGGSGMGLGGEVRATNLTGSLALADES